MKTKSFLKVTIVAIIGSLFFGQFHTFGIDIMSNLKHATQVIGEVLVTDEGAQYKDDNSNVNVKIDKDGIGVKEGKRVGIGTRGPIAPLQVKGTGWIEKLRIEEDATVNKNLLVKSNLNVKGDTKLESNLEVGKDTKISGNTNIDQDLQVGWEAHIRKDFSVGGTTTLRGNTNVKGYTKIEDNLQVLKDTNISGNTNIDKNLIVRGNTNIKSGLNVDKNSNFNQKLTAKELEVLDNFVVGKNLTVSGELAVNSYSVFQGPVKINNKLYLTGTKPGQTLRIGPDGNMISSSNLQNLGNKILVKGVPLELKCKDGLVSKLCTSFFVQGNSEFSGNVGMGKNLTVLGEITTPKLNVDKLVHRKVEDITVSGDLLPEGSSSHKDLGASDNRWKNLRIENDVNAGERVKAGKGFEHGKIRIENDNYINTIDGTLYLQHKGGKVQVGDKHFPSSKLEIQGDTETKTLTYKDLNALGNCGQSNKGQTKFVGCFYGCNGDQWTPLGGCVQKTKKFCMGKPDNSSWVGDSSYYDIKKYQPDNNNWLYISNLHNPIHHNIKSYSECKWICNEGFKLKGKICEKSRCGDGFHDPSLGEECDYGDERNIGDKPFVKLRTAFCGKNCMWIYPDETIECKGSAINGKRNEYWASVKIGGYFTMQSVRCDNGFVVESLNPVKSEAKLGDGRVSMLGPITR